MNEPDTLRLFVGIELPPAVVSEIESLQRRLRSRSPRLRWSPPENVHLTLRFIGASPEAELDRVRSALANVPAFAPFTLRTAALGVFGGARARVLWWGLGGELGSLLQVQRAVEAALAENGIVTPDAQAFRPHLTLARAPETASAAERRAVQSLAGTEPPEAVEFTVKEFSLFRSKLFGERAIYENLGRYPVRIP